MNKGHSTLGGLLNLNGSLSREMGFQAPYNFSRLLRKERWMIDGAWGMGGAVIEKFKWIKNHLAR